MVIELISSSLDRRELIIIKGVEARMIKTPVRIIKFVLSSKRKKYAETSKNKTNKETIRRKNNELLN